MSNSRTGEELIKRYYELRDRLYKLVDADPQEAIRAARDLAVDEELGKRNLDSLKASLLIDAGIQANDAEAVDDGVHILEDALTSNPEKLDLKYCLANGLVGKADLVAYAGPQWYLETADTRRRARNLYRCVETRIDNPEISSRSLTNLANSLIKSYRFLEAYDFYIAALQHDPKNGIALTGAARILLHFNNQGIGEEESLLGTAAEYLDRARENPERLEELGGTEAAQKLSDLINMDIPRVEPPDLTKATPYQIFTARHRLALSPTIDRVDLENGRWDCLSLGSITEADSSESGVPPVFAMFNTLKSDYLAARYVAFLALENTEPPGDSGPETGMYSDTLDYACYGMATSFLTLAQRASLDILDKIAVAASEYLELPGNPKSINFRNRWFVKKKDLTEVNWRPEVRREISEGNSALIALAEVSYDIGKAGFLEDKRLKRDAATHRFAVLHDISTTPGRHSKFVDHYDLSDFENQVVETLQLTRAAIFYFVEMVRIRESRKGTRDGLVMPFDVPDHDWIRGRRG